MERQLTTTIHADAPVQDAASEALDEALEETVPASDPISPFGGAQTA